MTPAQRKRTKEFLAILSVMGGRLDGHNIENYARVSKITHTTIASVKAWIPNRVTGVPARIIPAIKLEALRNAA